MLMALMSVRFFPEKPLLCLSRQSHLLFRESEKNAFDVMSGKVLFMFGVTLLVKNFIVFHTPGGQHPFLI